MWPQGPERAAEAPNRAPRAPLPRRSPPLPLPAPPSRSPAGGGAEPPGAWGPPRPPLAIKAFKVGVPRPVPRPPPGDGLATGVHPPRAQRCRSAWRCEASGEMAAGRAGDCHRSHAAGVTGDAGTARSELVGGRRGAWRRAAGGWVSRSTGALAHSHTHSFHRRSPGPGPAASGEAGPPCPGADALGSGLPPFLWLVIPEEQKLFHGLERARAPQTGAGWNLQPGTCPGPGLGLRPRCVAGAVTTEWPGQGSSSSLTSWLAPRAVFRD